MNWIVRPRSACTSRSPSRERLAVAMIDRGVLRPAPIVLDLVLQERRHDGMHRKAVARIADGRRRDLAEAHGAVALQRQDPGVGRRRNHGAQEAHGNRAVVVADELLDVERLRPPAEAGDRHGLVAVGQVDQHRRDAGELDLVAVHDTERDAAGDAGVDGVAAGAQDRMRRLGREILAGRCHVVVADDHWLHPHQALPRPLHPDPSLSDASDASRPIAIDLPTGASSRSATFSRGRRTACPSTMRSATASPTSP